MTKLLDQRNQGDDLKSEVSLRPRALRDFIGQAELKQKLTIFIEAAKKRCESLDHTLFHGPPGLGKTSLAHVIGVELGVSVISTSGPALDKPGQLAAILTNLNPKDILFVDEIHRLSRLVEESLYPALEDFQLDIVVGEGTASRVIKLNLPPFTLVGATTRAGQLTSPLMGRFGMSLRLDYYTPEDLKTIVIRSANILKCRIEEEGAFEISRRARGTPRIANRLLRRARDFAEVCADGNISRSVAIQALDLLEVDNEGLDKTDRVLLRTLIEKFGGGPVGIETMATALSEERETLEDVYEPYLIQCGYLNRTPRGRVATDLAYRHLGLNPPKRVSSGPAGSSANSNEPQLPIFP